MTRRAGGTPPVSVRIHHPGRILQRLLSRGSLMARFPGSIVLAVAAFAASSVPAYADPRADVQAALERVVASGGFVAHVNGQVFGPGTPVTER